MQLKKDSLKVGDVIWIKNGDSAGTWTAAHVMIAMSSPNSEGWFLACSGNVNGKVSWPSEGAEGTSIIPEEGTDFATHSIIWTRYDASTLPEAASVTTEYSVSGELWDDFADLGAPTSTNVAIVKGGSKLYESVLPIKWNSSSFDPNATQQRITGTLDKSGNSRFASIDLPEVYLQSIGNSTTRVRT